MSAGLTVLTVDDSRTMRDMVAFTLSSAGYAVAEAEDGEDALRVLAGRRVDLVIADLNMPRMDGLSLIRAIRAGSAGDALRAVPILMLTTESDAARKQEGREAGATGWIVKPFDPDRLVQVVRRVCG
ncbi:MAG TPA: response regulator [Alphaproteobacteria bacterium]|nr:response regulator [Alphaproteobacteria bacterium]